MLFRESTTGVASNKEDRSNVDPKPSPSLLIYLSSNQSINKFINK